MQDGLRYLELHEQKARTAMRKLLIVCAGMITIMSIVSVNLWRALHQEREMSAALRTELTEARTSIVRLSIPPRPAAVPAPLRGTAAPATAPAPTATPAPAANPAPALNVTVNNGAVQVRPGVSEKDLLKDPEYRKARLASLRFDLRRSNPGVGEELGMTEREVEQFFDLLAESQIRLSELSPTTVGPTTPAMREEINQRQRELRQQQEQAVAAAVGAPTYAKWQQYQQTTSARSQAISMGSQLAQMGMPLTSAQVKPLTSAMILHQQSQRLDAQYLQAMVGTTNTVDAQTRARQQEESRRRSEESNRRLLEAMRPILNAQQLALFREQYEAQEAMNRARARVQERLPPSSGAQR
jgi:hypothetical protein